MPLESDAAVVLHVGSFDDHVMHAAGDATRIERRQQLRRNPYGARAVLVTMAGVSGRERGESG